VDKYAADPNDYCKLSSANCDDGGVESGGGSSRTDPWAWVGGLFDDGWIDLGGGDWLPPGMSAEAVAGIRRSMAILDRVRASAQTEYSVTVVSPGGSSITVSSPQMPVVAIRKDASWKEKGILQFAFHDDGGILGDAGRWVLWYRSTNYEYQGFPVPGGVGVYTGMWIPDDPRRYDPSGVALSWPAQGRVFYAVGVGTFMSWPTRPAP